MSTSKSLTAVAALLIASFAGLAVAGPPTPADAGQQSSASREGGARVKPVHLPTGQQPGNQPAPEQAPPSAATSTIPRTPTYQNSQRNSARGAANITSTRRHDAALGDEGANKLDQQAVQDAMSQQSQAEGIRGNVAKRTQGPVPKRTDDAIFGPSAPRGPTRNADGAARSSTIGASGIVPPEDPGN
jgi:hypothetical protein